MSFIWRGRDCTAYGDLGAALARLVTKRDAAGFWAAYVEYLSRPDAELGGKTPEQVARSNIGYLMGYYSEAERKRVYALFSEFEVAHPIFGTTEPTSPEQLVEAANRMAFGDET